MTWDPKDDNQFIEQQEREVRDVRDLPQRIYLVMRIDHRSCSDDHSELRGIFDHIEMAVTYAESLCTHRDDECWIKEFPLNLVHQGKTIWSSREKFIKQGD